MIKNIYFLWFQSLEKAPYIVTKCYQSWKDLNPDWNLILLDDKNIKDYVDYEKFINKEIMLCHLADIVRLLLLNKYGGVWVDATTFCNRPLNEWLDKYMQKGFFAFANPGPDRLLSNWFICSEKENYITAKWLDSTIEYYLTNKKAHTYFIHHYLFGTLYKTDDNFKKIWDNVIKFSADAPHYLLNKLSDTLNETIKGNIDSKKTPLYKLTYKFNNSNVYEKDNTVFKYLISNLI